MMVSDVETQERLAIHRLISSEVADPFPQDVRAGLTSRPKVLPPKYFYDELGSRLFDAICFLPEYYLTRAESEILRAHAGEIISESLILSRRAMNLIELGNGSSVKTRYFIDALLDSGRNLQYIPIDISEPMLERSSLELLSSYPQLRVTAYAADYYSALRALADASGTPAESDAQNLVLFLGSSIGNLDPEQSAELLRAIRQILRPGDALALGTDLRKSPDVLLAAYNDALGVTAAFNLNLLVRINRELGADFDLRRFRHRAVYDEERGRIEMHVVSAERQTVRASVIELEIDFEAGETIHTENSYKYDVAFIARLARESGFRLHQTWFDSGRRFGLSLLSAS